MQTLLQRPALRVRPAPAQRNARRIVCQASQQPEESPLKKAVAVPLAGMVAAALIAGAAVPEEALAANRSGGRVGGSSGFASRKAAAPSRSIQTQAAPSVSSTTVVVAPAPVYASPFGFSPFGGFGFGFGMPVYAPVSFFSFSSLFSLMFVMLLFSVVFSVIRGFMSAKNNQSSKKDDSWGDL